MDDARITQVGDVAEFCGCHFVCVAVQPYTSRRTGALSGISDVAGALLALRTAIRVRERGALFPT